MVRQAAGFPERQPKPMFILLRAHETQAQTQTTISLSTRRRINSVAAKQSVPLTRDITKCADKIIRLIPVKSGGWGWGVMQTI